jgi:DNA invertase Pin-like site-specific DNA recombinase
MTRRGAHRDDRTSLSTQEQRIKQTASSPGGERVEIFRDVESGRRDVRPEYMRMLAYVVEHSIDVVLVQYLDRFGRNPKEILSRIWQLQEQGVTV